MNGAAREVKAEIFRRFGCQADFAKALGKWPGVVSDVVRGRRGLSAAERERWAALLEISPDLLARLRG
jgi:transcriptional regulator with XRE-family HTH domain